MNHVLCILSWIKYIAYLNNISYLHMFNNAVLENVINKKFGELADSLKIEENIHFNMLASQYLFF